MDKQSHPNNLSAQLAYQSVFELINSAILVLNHEHVITYINPTAKKLLQASQDDVVGQTLKDVMARQHQLDFSLDNLPNEPIQLNVGGETRYYTLEFKPLDEQLGYLVIFEDVTLQQTALAEVQRLKSGYGDYAHTVGHDVKSPLGVAIGYSNMLQTELDEGTEERFFVDEIFHTAMRIMYICNELILLGELYNLDSVDFSSVNLKYIIDNILRRFKKSLTENDIAIQIPEVFPTVFGYTLWVEEALVNYVHHALQQSPNTIAIGVESLQDKRIRIWVKHDGNGLSVEEQTSLFNNDFILEEVRAEGNGLGMGVSKHIIQLLDGDVGIEDEHTLYFTLPTENSVHDDHDS